MRYDGEWKERTRQRVLEEAAKAIRLEGARAIGVAGVMARAGLTHGGFYAHFESKDALVAATIDLMIQQVSGRFRKVTGELAPDAALRAYVEFYLSARHRDSTTTTCPLPLVAAEVPRLGGASQHRYAEGVAALTGALAGLVAAHGLAEPQSVASSIVAELIGAMALARGVGDRAQSDAILAQSRQSILARLHLPPTTEASPPQ